MTDCPTRARLDLWVSEKLDAAPAVRAEALAGAARLVSGISCVPPVPTTVGDPPPIDGAGGGKKAKGHGGHHDD